MAQELARGHNRQLRLIATGGKDQVVSVLTAIHSAVEDGSWIMLQNCHLAPQELLRSIDALMGAIAAMDVDALAWKRKRQAQLAHFRPDAAASVATARLQGAGRGVNRSVAGAATTNMGRGSDGSRSRRRSRRAKQAAGSEGGSSTPASRVAEDAGMDEEPGDGAYRADVTMIRVPLPGSAARVAHGRRHVTLRLKHTFRIWLTSEPTPPLPVKLLRKSICVTLEDTGRFLSGNNMLRQHCVIR